MEQIGIGIAGFGTVGSGLAHLLEQNHTWITQRLAQSIAIKKILVRDLNKPRAFHPQPEALFTTSADDLITDQSISIIVELMGGIDAAKKLIINALSAGKHVVTANKHLLAKHGSELFAYAAQKGVGLFYEASVAGGIPTIATLRESLAGNKISEILGILNGTSNYILSEMSDCNKQLDFAHALSQATELGYAEADPSMDIDGFDTAHKLTILIRLAFGMDYPLHQIPVQGISQVSSEDILYAREFGYRVKLIAEAREIDGYIQAGVFPAFVKYTYLLARVGGNYNAIRITGNAVGSVMLHGQGAGALPTASAVLADIMALIHKKHAPDNTGFRNIPLAPAKILPPAKIQGSYYIRARVADKVGVMAAIAKSMADHEISIAQAVQKTKLDTNNADVVFLTHTASEAAMKKVINEINSMDFIQGSLVHYRMLHSD